MCAGKKVSMYLKLLVMHTYIYLIVSKYSTGDLIFYISTQYDQFRYSD